VPAGIFPKQLFNNQSVKTRAQPRYNNLLVILLWRC
jgi:hypothetical protein